MKKISSSTFDALKTNAAKALKESLFLEFRSDSLCNDYADGELVAIINTALDNGQSAGIETDRGFAAFAMMTILCGTEFQNEPEVASYISQDPDTRVEELADFYINHYRE